MRRHLLLFGPVFALLVAIAFGGEVRFKKTVVDRTFRSEGVATADVNHDGKRDILAGDVWYAAPDWKMHEVRKVGTYNGAKGYSRCFQNYAYDVNGDGWTDSIVVNWPGKECVWLENPQNKPGHWKQRIVCPSACGETALFADLLGTGKPVLGFAVQPQAVVAWVAIPENTDAPWDVHPITPPKSHSTHRYTHGYGFGDVNGDGRKDFLCTKGWWEAPADRTQSPWTFHPCNLGPACADMVVYDFDGDGDNDIATSSAHKYGIWWFEHVKTAKGIEFRRHEFFKGYSQMHALILADINRDGLMDLVTGKRHFAHQGHDPGGKDPAMLSWFELRRPAKGKVEFIHHLIDNDSGVGTQFEVSDINGDGRLDVITSNKKGVHLFIQQP